MSKFEASIRSTPDNSDTLINYGQVLKRKASPSGRGTYTYLVKAFEKYKMARSYDHIWKLGINVQTNFKDAWQNSNQLPQLASMCFQACSAPNSGYAFDGLYNWALVLLKQAQKTGDDAIYAKAGEIFRRALKTRQFNSNVGMTDWATHSSLTDIDLAILLEIVQSSVRALKTRQFNSNVGMTDWATHSSLTEIDLAILLEIVQSSVRALKMHQFNSNVRMKDWATHSC
jgi:hypothetical protein